MKRLFMPLLAMLLVAVPQTALAAPPPNTGTPIHSTDILLLGPDHVVKDSNPRGDFWTPGRNITNISEGRKYFYQYGAPLPNPASTGTCGDQKIVMVLDLSASITDENFTTYTSSIKQAIAKLRDRGLTLGIYTFASEAPAYGNNNFEPRELTSATLAEFNTYLDSLKKPNRVVRYYDQPPLPNENQEHTNWQAAFDSVANSATTFDEVLFVTDGVPETQNYSRWGGPSIIDLALGVESANKVKRQGTHITGVFVGEENKATEFFTTYDRKENIEFYDTKGKKHTRTGWGGPAGWDGLDYEDYYIQATSRQALEMTADANSILFSKDFGTELENYLVAQMKSKCNLSLSIVKGWNPTPPKSNTSTITHAGKKYPLASTVNLPVQITDPVAFKTKGLKVEFSENAQKGYVLQGVTCDNRAEVKQVGKTVTVTLRNTGATTCQMTNKHLRDPKIVVTKVSKANPQPVSTTCKRADAQCVKNLEHVFNAPITWQYQVSNPSDYTLTEVKAVDDKLGPLNCPKTMLKPDKTMTCTASGKVR